MLNKKGKPDQMVLEAAKRLDAKMLRGKDAKPVQLSCQVTKALRSFKNKLDSFAFAQNDVNISYFRHSEALQSRKNPTY